MTTPLLEFMKVLCQERLAVLEGQPWGEETEALAGNICRKIVMDLEARHIFIAGELTYKVSTNEQPENNIRIRWDMPEAWLEVYL